MQDYIIKCSGRYLGPVKWGESNESGQVSYSKAILLMLIYTYLGWVMSLRYVKYIFLCYTHLCQNSAFRQGFSRLKSRFIASR
jgi:hypothetical protein